MRKHISLGIVILSVISVVLLAGCAHEAVRTDTEASTTSAASGATSQPRVSVATPSSSVQPGQNATTSIPQAAPQIAAATSQPQNAAVGPALQSSLEKIYFDFDSANLSETARSTLNKNAQLLLKKPAVKIRIEGNCDERGSAEYNLALGERRAKSVQQYLITLGVKGDRITTISFGKEKPAVQGNDEAAWSKNRRAEFVITQ